MAEIQKQNEAKFAELSSTKQKLNDVHKALSGEESKEVQVEKFFREFGEDPDGKMKKVFDKYYQERASAEIEPLKEKLKKKEMEEREGASFARLQSNNKDYAEVMKELPKYVKPEEFKNLENNPDRPEIIYSLIKMRKGSEAEKKKLEESEATKQAKEIENKKAVSETPTGGKIEAETEAQRRRKEINEGIAEGKWNDEELRRKSFDEYWELTQKK